MVEGVEELLLDTYLAGYELDIVHEEEVNIAVFVAELLLGVVLDGLNHLIRKVVALDIGYLGVGIGLVYLLPYGQKQMRLSEPRVAVDEKRVIGKPRVIGDRDGGSVGEFV